MASQRTFAGWERNKDKLAEGSHNNSCATSFLNRCFYNRLRTHPRLESPPEKCGFSKLIPAKYQFCHLQGESFWGLFVPWREIMSAIAVFGSAVRSVTNCLIVSGRVALGITEQSQCLTVAKMTLSSPPVQIGTRTFYVSEREK